MTRDLVEPVLFLVFNRPETTVRVFEAIRAAKPPRLYVAADGPRTGYQGEAECCAEVRRIATAIDWPCEVKTLFRESNLGCRDAVSSAVTWFFDNETEGIILEDDCLPCLDFFLFAQTLLERYRNDIRVMQICGGNFSSGLKFGRASYYFSKYAHIWGWASWRRAWQHYDVDMKDLPSFLSCRMLECIFPWQPVVQRRWEQILRKTYERSPDFNTWDCQWTYALFKQGGLCLFPNLNLVMNIGGDGTHNVNAKLMSIPFGSLGEISHPEFPLPDLEADRLLYNTFYANRNFFIRLFLRGRRELQRIFQ